MAVAARTLRLQAQLRHELDMVTDRHTRALVAAWVDAWNEVEPDLNATLLDMLVAGDKVTIAQLLQSSRLRKSLAVIAGRLGELSVGANRLIVAGLRDVVETAGAAQASVVDSQLPPHTDLVAIDSWSQVSDRQIDAIVRRSTEQITALTKPLAPQAYDAVRRELIRGVAAGSNPNVTARRMVARAEGRFNGGLNRAMVISRTETLDAHRAGAALGMSQHADVLRGWEWLAVLDERTCASCWSQHGSEHPLDEPGPNDHQQGRCARNALTRSWSDLGFDIPEPPSVTPDAQTQFDALPAAKQLEILGPSRHAAYVAGDFPMDAWSVRKSTYGWRDSYHVAPAPRAARRAVA